VGTADLVAVKCFNIFELCWFGVLVFWCFGVLVVGLFCSSEGHRRRGTNSIEEEVLCGLGDLGEALVDGCLRLARLDGVEGVVDELFDLLSAVEPFRSADRSCAAHREISTTGAPADWSLTHHGFGARRVAEGTALIVLLGAHHGDTNTAPVALLGVCLFSPSACASIVVVSSIRGAVRAALVKRETTFVVPMTLGVVSRDDLEGDGTDCSLVHPPTGGLAFFPAHRANTCVATLAGGIAERTGLLKALSAGVEGNPSTSSLGVLPAGVLVGETKGNGDEAHEGDR
jgi:hypothetical protein